MAFARMLKFALFGHAAAGLACYELGRHNPRGYFGTTSSSRDAKKTLYRVGELELAGAAALLLVSPEYSALFLAYSSSLFLTYHYGKYRANVALENEPKPRFKR